MRLDEKDIGVRRRLVGQVEFINQGVVGSSISLSDSDLRQYLEQNEQRYVQPATITFTHVFFNIDRRGDDDAVQQAEATLDLLNGGQSGLTVPFHKAPAYGDRFLYHQNYVDDQAEEVASHFVNNKVSDTFYSPSETRTGRDRKLSGCSRRCVEQASRSQHGR